MHSEQLKDDILYLVKKYYIQKQKEEIQNNKINYAGRVYDEKEIQNLVESALEFQLTGGHWIDEFEKKFAKFVEAKHCLMVNSGSSANLLAFMALTSPWLGDRQILRDDEIICVAAAFPTSVSPIIQYGAVPVFVDVELETANIDVNQLKEALTPLTKAVFVAHTLGNVFDIESIRYFCNKHNLWFISDECDSLGSTYKCKQLSYYADISTHSFFPAHTITTGQGGAVVTNNKELYKIMHSLRDWGRDYHCDKCTNDCKKRYTQKDNMKDYDCRYSYSHFGYNLQPTEMQASIGVAQLEKLPDFIKKRKENFNILYEGLRHLSDKIIFQERIVYADVSPFGFLMTLKEGKRIDLIKYLEEKGIQTRMLFSGNITHQMCTFPYTLNWNYEIVGDLKNTDIIKDNSFFIGVYPGMTKNNLQYMIDTISKYFKGK